LGGHCNPVGSGGYAVLRGLLNDSQVRELAALRGTGRTDDRVPLAAEELGCGNLFYFSRRLPAPLEDLRTAFYRRLAPIANRWNGALDISHRYPDTLNVSYCRTARRDKHVRSRTSAGC